MGRKNNRIANTVKVDIEENKDMARDRIGEPVDLNKCPVCTAHTDCFGNISGKCTALNDSGACNGQGCVFYKNREQALVENKAAFRQLMQDRRYELIHKYRKQLAALGAMDDEATNGSFEGGYDFEAYAEADYQKQLEEMSNETNDINETEQNNATGLTEEVGEEE